jgi:hypothetical protein
MVSSLSLLTKEVFVTEGALPATFVKEENESVSNKRSASSEVTSFSSSSSFFGSTESSVGSEHVANKTIAGTANQATLSQRMEIFINGFFV